MKNKLALCSLTAALMTATTLAHAAPVASVDISGLSIFVGNIGAPTAVAPTVTFDTGLKVYARGLMSFTDLTSYQSLGEAINPTEELLTTALASGWNTQTSLLQGQANAQVVGGASPSLHVEARLSTISPDPVMWIDAQAYQSFGLGESNGYAPIDAFTLDAHSYLTISGTYTVSASILPDTTPNNAFQYGMASLELALDGVGPTGAGRQNSYASGVSTDAIGTVTSPFTVSFFNNTSNPMQGKMRLNISASVGQSVSPQSPVPEPSGVALALAGMGVAAAALRRRARSVTRHGAVVSMLAGAAGAASAATGATSTASISFSDITFSVQDLNPTDAYLPSLSFEPPVGHYNTHGQAGVILRSIDNYTVTGQDIQQYSLPPTDPLFQTSAAQASVQGMTAAVSTTKGLTDAGPHQAQVSASVQGAAGTMSVAAASFSLGDNPSAYDQVTMHLSPQSFLVLSMKLDLSVSVAPLSTGQVDGAQMDWDMTLQSVKPATSGFVTDTVYDLGRVMLMPASGTDAGAEDHRLLTYNFFNATNQTQDVYFKLTAQAGVYSMMASTPTAVPEPQALALALSGLLMVGWLGRRKG